MEEKKIIIISKKVREELRKEGWCYRTIARALADEVRTETTLKIRKKALELGGEFWV